jgi:hypothetical protein
MFHTLKDKIISTELRGGVDYTLVSFLEVPDSNLGSQTYILTEGFAVFITPRKYDSASN